MLKIRTPRLIYKPFEYPKYEEVTMLQWHSEWLHTEVSLEGDLSDWNGELSVAERDCISVALKVFTQSEVPISEYWSSCVSRWFPKPEISGMAISFAKMEVVHQKGYSYLNDSLHLDDYSAFLEDKVTRDKIDNLITPTGDSDKEVALSLAVFSAFAEGVALFSSFAILLSFKTRNLLKGVGNIIAWSIKDESLHSSSGCDLFREMISEDPSILDEDLISKINSAAKLTIKLEDAFIDKVFESGNLKVVNNRSLVSFNPTIMKNFIRHRTNLKLVELGLKSIYNNINDEHLKSMDWFDELSSSVEHRDFFSSKVTSYHKSTDWGDSWRLDGIDLLK